MNFKNSIGYMIHHLAFSLDSASDQILREKFAIGLAQLRILLVLEAQDGITQKKIAEELSQTEASVSRQIKILAQKGLIEIEGNFDNRRERLIYQTHEGHVLAQKSIQVLNEYHGPIFDSLSEKEQQQLAATLQKLSEGLEKAN
jgi:DNA-binding MarR family transcriptional regulator